MPAAVQLDGQLCARAIEIQDVIVERMLAAKFVAREISVPQVSPKNTLRLSRPLSQQSSTIHNDSFNSSTRLPKSALRMPFTSILSPQAGRGGEALDSGF